MAWLANVLPWYDVTEAENRHRWTAEAVRESRGRRRRMNVILDEYEQVERELRR